MKDGFLRECRGVIHVGANTGRERDVYKKHGLRVLWIEANPEAFKVLFENIKNYKNQKAIFMKLYGYHEIEREEFVKHPRGGTYYNIVYEKISHGK